MYQDVSELKGIPSDAASAALDINGLGNIVGWVDKLDGDTTSRMAVMLSLDSDPVELGVIGGSHSEAVAVSEQGLVVGNSTTADDQTDLNAIGVAAFSWNEGTLTPLLKRLEAAGLVQRLRDAADERRVLLQLTAAGRGLKTRAAAIPVAIAGASGCTLDELAALTARLKSLRADILATDPPAA